MPTKAKAIELGSHRSARVLELLRDGQRNGSTRKWRELRKWHLMFNPLCVFCSMGATEVDHIKPISQGGEMLDPDNLRSVCEDCHDAVTANLQSTGRNEMPAMIVTNRANRTEHRVGG